VNISLGAYPIVKGSVTCSLNYIQEDTAIIPKMASEKPLETIMSPIDGGDKTIEDTVALEEGPVLTKVPSEAPYTIFSRGTRIFIVAMTCVSAVRTSINLCNRSLTGRQLISPFAATLYYPALNPLAQQLHVSSSAINISITTYMVRH
jgi:hypothetical protein